MAGDAVGASAPAAVERLNVELPPGTRLEDVVGAALRQTLALSGDGTRLVFLVREPDGRRQLYLRRVDRIVTAEPIAGAAGGDMPFFSPDGQWLGFAVDGKLKKVLLSGGQPVTLCDAPEPRGASWGDDDTIVFTAGARGGMSRVPASGGTPTTQSPRSIPRGTKTVTAGRSCCRAPAPSCSTSSSTDETAGTRHIDLLEFATGARRTIVASGSYPRFAAGRLLYGEAGNLYAVPFDTARLSMTGTPVPVLDDVRMDLTATGRVFADASLSGALAYVPGFPRPGARRLLWLDRAGTVTPVTAETRAYRGAQLSPDGRSLAVLIEDVAGTAVWLLDLARNTWDRLTSAGEATTPAWTPDGRRILFSASLGGSPGHSTPCRPTAAAPRHPISAAPAPHRHAGRAARWHSALSWSAQDAEGDDISYGSRWPMAR